MALDTPRGIATALVAALLCAAAPAGADPETMSAERWGAVDLLGGSITAGGADLTLIGIAVRGGMAVGPRLGFGLRAPIAHARGDGTSGTSLGNLTGDVYFTAFRGFGTFPSRIYFTGSLSAPTASSGGEGLLASGAFTAFWIPEPGLYHPDATSARVAGTFFGGDGRRYIEVELDGQHLFVGGGEEDATRFRLRVGGGYSLSERIAGFGQLTSVWNPDAPANEDHFLHVLEAGLAVAGQPRGQARLSIYFPLDESYRDELEAMGFLLTVAGTF